MSAITDLRDKFISLINAGEMTFNNLSPENRQTFKDLFTSGRTFTDDQRTMLHKFWFRGVAPDHAAMIEANELLPSNTRLSPVQALNGKWYVCMYILTDEATWGAVFPLLKGIKIERLNIETDFPTEEI